MHASDARVGLAPDILDKLIGTLSSGQLQRLLMGMALIGRTLQETRSWLVRERLT